MGYISKLVVQETLYDIKDARAREDASSALSQISEIIDQAHGGSTEGNTELLNIRSGYDGTMFATAGDAVRSQVRGLNERLSSVETNIEGVMSLGIADMEARWKAGM